MRTILTCFVAAAMMLGCQETPVTETASGPALPAQFGDITSGMQFARNTDATQEERMTAILATAETTFGIAATAETWQDAHAATQRALAAAESDVERSMLEQATAKMMLTGHLVRVPDDPEAARVALTYAERLVERQSPETEVVLAAVTTFGDAWPAAKTRAVAVGAADALDAYIEGGAECVDCERSERAKQSLRASGQETGAFTARQTSAALRLREAIQ